MIRLDLEMISVMIKKAIPLTLNEVLFSMATSIIFIAYSRCNETLIPAISVVDTVMQIAYIIFSGLSSAVSILIGNKLGANELSEAKENANKLIAFGVVVGMCITVMIFIVAPLIAEFYNVESFVKAAIVTLLRIKSCLLPIYVYDVCIFFVLRAGGDTLSTLIMDSGVLWCLNVTVSTVVSVYFDIPLVYLYAIVESMDVLKLFIASYFYKKGKWLKNITIGMT